MSVLSPTAVINGLRSELSDHLCARWTVGGQIAELRNQGWAWTSIAETCNLPMKVVRGSWMLFKVFEKEYLDKLLTLDLHLIRVEAVLLIIDVFCRVNGNGITGRSRVIKEVDRIIKDPSRGTLRAVRMSMGVTSRSERAQATPRTDTLIQELEYTATRITNWLVKNTVSMTNDQRSAMLASCGQLKQAVDDLYAKLDVSLKIAA